MSQILAPNCHGQCKQPATKMRDLVHSVTYDPRQPWFWAQRVTLHDAARCPDARTSQALLSILPAGQTPTLAEVLAAESYRVSVSNPQLIPFGRKTHVR